MKTKILVVTPYPHDANSFWRCLGPLSYLEKHSQGQIEIKLVMQGISWAEVLQHDLVFLHRPCRQDDLTVMQIAYNLGIPCWVDYDDWLFELPGWNPHKAMYDSPQMQAIMAQCLACADLVSVSTQELANQFQKVNPNVVVIPNAYRSDLFKFRAEQLEERTQIAVWRGTNTHDGDLLSVREGFLKLEASTLFLGGPSWLLLSGMDQSKYQVRPGVDVTIYNRQIWDFKPKVFIFPLVDCLFNRCKSNIAYIESMHAGAICVAPDLPEWRKEGVITYEPHNSQSFVDAVNNAFQIPWDQHQSILETAFESMKDRYDIQVVNTIRRNVVQKLTVWFEKNKNNPYDQNIGLNALSILKNTQVTHASQSAI